MPVRSVAQARASSSSYSFVQRTPVSALSDELSRDERPCGSLPAFAESDSGPITAAQLLSTLLPDGLRLLRIPIPASLWAHLTVCFPLQIARGRIRAYHVPRERLSGLGPAALPVAHRLRQMS